MSEKKNDQATQLSSFTALNADYEKHATSKARMFAMAPYLMDAVDLLLEDLNAGRFPTPARIKIAQSALAKAKGEQ